MTLAVYTFEVPGFPSIGEKTGISDTRETFRKDMVQESADKLHHGKADGFFFSGISVCNGKSNSLSIIIEDSVV